MRIRTDTDAVVRWQIPEIGNDPNGISRIIFRVFQGIGGAGIYALTMVIVAEVAPKRHFGVVYGMVNLVFVAASAVGPVIGGAITTYSTWRWCFFLK